MSQSSVEEQVRDLAASGFPVSQGTRISGRSAGPVDLHQFGSDLWFSRWCRNVFRNYPILSKSFGARFLHESCHGMPCFVVGVGPSLDADIQDLKMAKKRAIIIAVDAALRPLLANGITPDLVVSFDCKANQNLLWQDIPKDVRIPGLLNSCTAPDSIATWPGPILFYNQYHTQDELCHRILPDVLPELGQIPSAGTVGNMACLAAHLMGCDPVCVVGFDFCYQPIQQNVEKWRYRAQDYVYRPQQADRDGGWDPTEIKELYDNDERLSHAFTVKSDNAQEFKSDPELAWYLESFKNLMPHFKVPIMNCTPNGLIPKTGFPSMTVIQAIEKYCKTEYQGGRTALAHLDKIIPDPRIQ